MSSAPIVQAEAKEAEAIVKAGKPVRGYVFKDDEGHVISIYLHYYSDEKIESIDFSVFTRLESITFFSGKMTSRSLSSS
ncbi:MAG: hypothetical protein EXS16_19755 [Gemmataceae bacterium]|nr:hypothetical protein [Gemmataceae bacterium]